MSDYIAKDTYTGKQTMTLNANKHKVTIYTAREIAGFLSEGAVFESFGSVYGKERFGRTRYVADSAGNLHCYDSNGRKIIVHPADRKLRILVMK